MILKKKIFLIILFLPGIILAQESNVMEPIEALFEGMSKADSSVIRSVFTDDPSMRTVIQKDGKIFLWNGSLTTFLTSVAGAIPGDLAEPIWNPVIQFNDQIASVWVDYAFYYKGKLSHCGIDLFNLVSQDGRWKIFSITDTRTKTGCEIPEKIINMYKK